jgi:archaellum component FlaC
MKKNQTKEVTLQDVAQSVENLSKTVEDIAKSVENLAIMTQRGFEGMESRIATKEEVNKRFEEVDKRFDKMDERFDRVEHILYRGHDNRLERLEDDMLQVKTFLGKKLA